MVLSFVVISQTLKHPLPDARSTTALTSAEPMPIPDSNESRDTISHSFCLCNLYVTRPTGRCSWNAMNPGVRQRDEEHPVILLRGCPNVPRKAIESSPDHGFGLSVFSIIHLHSQCQESADTKASEIITVAPKILAGVLCPNTCGC